MIPHEPVPSAHLLYDEAFGALMAHSVRGLINYFRKHNLELVVVIKADFANTIQFRAPGEGATSVLVTKLVSPPPQSLALPKVEATIIIHKDATKDLARACIAHEIFHLWLELGEFERGGRKKWNGIPHTRAVEDACNQFAWQLCKMHDQFNKDIASRKQHIDFPDNLFDKPFKMSRTSSCPDWVLGIALDPTKAFWKPRTK